MQGRAVQVPGIALQVPRGEQVPTDKGTALGKPTPPPQNLDYALWQGPCPEQPYIESRVHPQRGFDRPGWLQVERHCLGMITGWGSHMYDIAQWGMDTESSGPMARFRRRGSGGGVSRISR